MDAVPLLIVNDQGVVVRANAAATATLGPSVGQACADLVSVCALRGSGGCSPSCAAGLVRQGASTATVGPVHGAIHRVLCTAMGDEVVVVLEPIELGIQLDETPSDRELEVLDLVAAGRTNADISQALGISQATVRTHLERVRRKLQADTRAEAVARALALGWVSLT